MLPSLLSTHRDFARLWYGHMVGALGDRLTHIALLTLFMVKENDPGTRIAALTFFSLLPFLLLGPLFGALADRQSRKKLMLLADGGRALLVLLIPVVWFKAASIVQIAILVFGLGVCSALFGPAKLSLVPMLVKKDRLMEANSFLILSGLIVTLVGTLFAGILLKFTGISLGFFVTAVAYGLSAFFVFQIKDKRAGQGELSAPVEYRDLWKESQEGFRYVGRHLLIFRLIQLSSVSAFLNAFAYILVVSYAAVILKQGSLGLGFLLSSAGLGMLLGAYFLNRRKTKISYQRVLWLGFFLTGIFLYLFYLRPNMVFAALFLAGAGMGVALQEITLDTMLQRIITEDFKAKIFGVKGFVNNLVFLSALILVGLAIKKWTAAGLLAFIGILSIGTAALIYLSEKEWVYQLIRKFFRLILRSFFDFKVNGLEHLPSRQKVILAANHSSLLDAVALTCAYPRRIYFMAAEFLFQHKFWGWIMRLAGCIEVKRDGFNKQAIKEALRILNSGYSLGIFPEGKITDDGRISPAKKGVGLLAKMAHAKIIPTAIEGTFEAWPKKRPFARPFPIEVRFGKPLAEKNFETPEDLAQEVMQEIAQVKLQMEKEGYLRVQPYEIVRHLIHFG